MNYCRKHIAKYAMPYDIEFRDELPKTLVGKVAYRVLEEEELQRIQATEAPAADDAHAADETQKKNRASKVFQRSRRKIVWIKRFGGTIHCW